MGSLVVAAVRTILANDPNRRTNAQAIADLAELGILSAEESHLDLTVGPKAGFWRKWRPRHLITNDLDLGVKAHYHEDVRALSPGWRRAFHVVVWDPGYAYRGRSALASDANYGVAGPYRSADEVDQLLLDGTLIAMGIARRLVLVKCQDQNVASAFRDQSGFVTEAVRREGGRVAGKLYINAYRQQPAGKKQLNIWGYHSVLLVIEVP